MQFEHRGLVLVLVREGQAFGREPSQSGVLLLLPGEGDLLFFE